MQSALCWIAILLPSLTLPSPKKTAISWIDSEADQLRAINRFIWEAAELGLEETRSSERLASYLESHGFRVTRGISGMKTAFVASYGSGVWLAMACGAAMAAYLLSGKRVRETVPSSTYVLGAYGVAAVALGVVQAPTLGIDLFPDLFLFSKGSA